MGVLAALKRRSAEWDYEAEDGSQQVVHLKSLTLNDVAQFEESIGDCEENKNSIRGAQFIFFLAARGQHEDLTEEEAGAVLDMGRMEEFQELLLGTLLPGKREDEIAECPECKHRFPFVKDASPSPE